MIIYNTETKSFSFTKSITSGLSKVAKSSVGKHVGRNAFKYAGSAAGSIAGGAIARQKAKQSALNRGFEKGSAEYKAHVNKQTAKGAALGAGVGLAGGLAAKQGKVAKGFYNQMRKEGTGRVQAAKASVGMAGMDAKDKFRKATSGTWNKINGVNKK